MEISNFSFDTIITVVRFMYLKDIKKEIKVEKVLGQVDYFDVLQAADYFQIPLLKKLCELSLANGMTKESVLDCYSIAKKFNADILKAAVGEKLCQLTGLVGRFCRDGMGFTRNSLENGPFSNVI